MEKTNKKTLEEIIRVDHAGERGAIKIYEGQLLALKTIKQDESLKDKIEKMKEQEKEHLEYFEKEIQKRKIKPTYLLPLWDILGVTLGFGTAFVSAVHPPEDLQLTQVASRKAILRYQIRLLP